MEKYETPEMEITLIQSTDIITESNNGDIELPWAP